MRVFPSKLLLFGEYAIIDGASALAMPLERFHGSWDKIKAPHQRYLQGKLKEFAEFPYLSTLPHFDAKLLQKELTKGMFFKSNIPTGYGLGSSGALCAAMYDRFCTEKETNLDQLKIIFSQMESFFHGKSSGIDPLTSFTKQWLLLDVHNNIQIVDAPNYDGQGLHCFLFDLDRKRTTAPLVNWYLEQKKTAEFVTEFVTPYVTLNTSIIEHFLKKEIFAFIKDLKALSLLQLKHLHPMVPDSFRPVWVQGLEEDRYFIKLCGAGGGGFMLGFCREWMDIEGLERYGKVSLVF